MNRVLNVSIIWILTVSLIFESSVSPVFGQMSKPVVSLQTTDLASINLQGLKLDPNNLLQLQFLIQHDPSQKNSDVLRDDAQLLIRYFLAAVTIPDKDLWVNLSPVEPDRIIPEAFAVTDMGRDFLKQDYELKQFTASLLNPDGETGRKFWEQVYGSVRDPSVWPDNIMESVNKVWIVPQKAVVYQQNGTVFITETQLKVMLESDYVARSTESRSEASGISSEIKQIIQNEIIPIIENEVNSGERFAPLRRMFHAMILAVWFKNMIRGSVMSRAYTGRNKIEGIEIDEQNAKEKIYQQYLEAFRLSSEGMIREAYDPVDQKVVTKKYIVGGFDFHQVSPVVGDNQAMLNVFDDLVKSGGLSVVETQMAPESVRNFLRRALELFFKELSPEGSEKFLSKEKISLERYLEMLSSFLISFGRTNGIDYLMQEQVGRPELGILDIVSLTPEALGDDTLGGRLNRIFKNSNREMIFNHSDPQQPPYVLRLSTSHKEQQYRHLLNDRFKAIVNVSDPSLHQGIKDNIPADVIDLLIDQIDEFEVMLDADVPDDISLSDVESIKKEFRMLIRKIRDDIRVYNQQNKSTIEQWREKFLSSFKSGRKEFYLFDLHGETSPVRLALQQIRWRMLFKKPTKFIFHGDAFDRGFGTKAIYKMFKAIDKLLGDEFVFVFGNHDVLMIEALITESDPEVQIQNMIRWFHNGGDTVLQELGIPGWSIREMITQSKLFENSEEKNIQPLKDILEEWKSMPAYHQAQEIALWMLKKGCFYHLNPRTGWMHTHAGFALKNGKLTVGYRALQQEQKLFLDLQKSIQNRPLAEEDRDEFTRIFAALRDAYWVSHWSDQISEAVEGNSLREAELRRYVTKVQDRIFPNIEFGQRRSMIQRVYRRLKIKESFPLQKMIPNQNKFRAIRDAYGCTQGVFLGHNHYDRLFVAPRIVGSDVAHKVHLTLDENGLSSLDRRFVYKNYLLQMAAALRIIVTGCLIGVSFSLGWAASFLSLVKIHNFFRGSVLKFKAAFFYGFLDIAGYHSLIFDKKTWLSYYQEDWKVWDRLNQKVDGFHVESFQEDEGEEDIKQRPYHASIEYDLYQMQAQGVQKIKIFDSLGRHHFLSIDRIPPAGLSIMQTSSGHWVSGYSDQIKKKPMGRELVRFTRSEHEIVVSIFDQDVVIKPVYRSLKDYEMLIEGMLRGFPRQNYMMLLAKMFFVFEKRLRRFSNRVRMNILSELIRRWDDFYAMTPMQKRSVLEQIHTISVPIYLRVALRPHFIKIWKQQLDDLIETTQFVPLKKGQSIVMTGEDQKNFSLPAGLDLSIKAGGVTYHLRVRRSGQAEMRRANSKIPQVEPGPKGVFKIANNTILVDFNRSDISITYHPDVADGQAAFPVQISIRDDHSDERSPFLVAGDNQAVKIFRGILKSSKNKSVSLVVGSGLAGQDSLSVLRELAITIMKDIARETNLDQDESFMENFKSLENLNYVQVVELIERLNREFSPFFENFMDHALDSLTPGAERYSDVARLLRNGTVKEVLDLTPGHQVRRAMKMTGAIAVVGFGLSKEGPYLETEDQQRILVSHIKEGMWAADDQRGPRPVFFVNSSSKTFSPRKLRAWIKRGIPIVHEISPLVLNLHQQHGNILDHFLQTSQVSWLGVDFQNPRFVDLMKDVFMRRSADSQQKPLRMLFNFHYIGTYHQVDDLLSQIPWPGNSRIILAGHSNVKRFVGDVLDGLNLKDVDFKAEPELKNDLTQQLSELGKENFFLEKYVALRILMEIDPTRQMESKLTGKSQDNLFAEWRERINNFYEGKSLLPWQYYDLMARLLRNRMNIEEAEQYYHRLIEELEVLVSPFDEINLDSSDARRKFVNDWRLNKRLINSCREVVHLIKMRRSADYSWILPKVQQAQDHHNLFALKYREHKAYFAPAAKAIVYRLRMESEKSFDEIAALLSPSGMAEHVDSQDFQGDGASQLRKLNLLVWAIAELMRNKKIEDAGEHIVQAQTIVDKQSIPVNFKNVKYLQILKAKYYYYKGRTGDEDAYREVLEMVRKNNYEFLNQLKALDNKEWWLEVCEIFIQAVWWESKYDLLAEDVLEEYQSVFNEALSWFDQEMHKDNPQIPADRRAVFYLLSAKINERYLRDDLPDYDQEFISRIGKFKDFLDRNSAEHESGSRLRNRYVIDAYQQHLAAVSKNSFNDFAKRWEAYEEAVRLYRQSMDIGLEEDRRRVEQGQPDRRYQIRPMIHLLQLHIDMILFLRENGALADNEAAYQKLLESAVKIQMDLVNLIGKGRLNPVLSMQIHRFEKMLRAFQADFVWFKNAEVFWSVNRTDVDNLLNKTSVINKIRDHLNHDSIVFLQGAPSSGKMIQTQLALGGDPFVRIDVRRSFFEYYRKKYPLVGWDHFKELYQSDISIRQTEGQWMKIEGADNLLKQIMDSPLGATIIFEQFDIVVGSVLEDSEFMTAQRVIDMFRIISASGRKAVFMFGDESLGSTERPSELAKWIDRNHICGLNRSWKDVAVRTGYFSDEEQTAILKFVKFSDEEAQQFKEKSQGLPIAYSEILKHIADWFYRKNRGNLLNVSRDDLEKQIFIKFRRTYLHTLELISPKVTSMFREMLNSSRQYMKVDSNSPGKALIDSGLAGQQGDQMVISEYVREVVQKELNLQQEFDRNELSLNDDSIETLSGRILSFGKKPALILDIHGLMLLSSWKREYVLAYAMIRAGKVDVNWDKMSKAEQERFYSDLEPFIKEGLMWMKKYFMRHLTKTSREAPKERLFSKYVEQEYNKTYDFDTILGGFQAAREIFKKDPDQYGKPTQFIKQFQKLIQAKEKQYGIKVPILILSGTETKYDLLQIQKSGLGEFFNNSANDKFVVGSDLQKEYALEDHDLGARGQIVKAFMERYPGHLLMSFDDWTKIYSDVREFNGFNIAVPQGGGEMFARNAAHHIAQGADFVVNSGQEESLEMILKIVETSIDRYVEQQMKQQIVSLDSGMDLGMLDDSYLQRGSNGKDALDKGGIDFSTRDWNVQAQGSFGVVEIPEESLAHIVGFSPVIVNISSVKAVDLLFSKPIVATPDFR